MGEGMRNIRELEGESEIQRGKESERDKERRERGSKRMREYVFV